MLHSHFIPVSYDIGHQVEGAIVRGAVYHTEGKIFSHLSLPESIILTVVIVGVLWLWNKRR